MDVGSVPASVAAAASSAAAGGAPVGGGASAPSSGAASSTNSASGQPTRPGETRAAVDAANKKAAENGYQFKFTYDDQAHLEVVKIIDSQTQQVLQQMPSQAALAVAQGLSDGAKPGTLLQTQA